MQTSMPFLLLKIYKSFFLPSISVWKFFGSKPDLVKVDVEQLDNSKAAENKVTRNCFFIFSRFKEVILEMRVKLTLICSVMPIYIMLYNMFLHFVEQSELLYKTIKPFKQFDVL